jgi:hypothetical protein
MRISLLDKSFLVQSDCTIIAIFHNVLKYISYAFPYLICFHKSLYFKNSSVLGGVGGEERKREILC